MDTRPCPHCDAPIRPTATFCLACDRAVKDTERGLSVADPTPVAGRRLVAGGLALAVVLAAVGTTYGVMRYLHLRHDALETHAAEDARRGITLLVRAEGGDALACRTADLVLAGSHRGRACLGIVGTDPGLRLEQLSVGHPRLAELTGTVRVSATLADRAGTRTLDRTVRLVQVDRQWRMSWDGKPEV